MPGVKLGPVPANSGFVAPASCRHLSAGRFAARTAATRVCANLRAAWQPCCFSPKNEDPTRSGFRTPVESTGLPKPEIVVLSEERERRISLEEINPPRPTEPPAALISNAVAVVFLLTRSKTDALQAV